MAKDFNVPKETALRVFEIRDIAQEQAQQVNKNASLTPDQRQAALDGIRAETEKTIVGIIGQDALNAYVQKGSWLKNLNKPKNDAARGGER